MTTVEMPCVGCKCFFQQEFDPYGYLAYCPECIQRAKAGAADGDLEYDDLDN